MFLQLRGDLSMRRLFPAMLTFSHPSMLLSISWKLTQMDPMSSSKHISWLDLFIKYSTVYILVFHCFRILAAKCLKCSLFVLPCVCANCTTNPSHVPLQGEKAELSQHGFCSANMTDTWGKQRDAFVDEVCSRRSFNLSLGVLPAESLVPPDPSLPVVLFLSWFGSHYGNVGETHYENPTLSGTREKKRWCGRWSEQIEKETDFSGAMLSSNSNDGTW